ncbi:hypothetical protein HOLleu_12277 [Holothuria leucospilota]|uniref:Uncharacterized protein n=1 Tax=Holothuria leucospilota TaxID=206669 RepID=A0A9Q1C9W9_HOLLE|nr:hypothetical protein HOLleu_12277 [Holothuria leucospilota]
MSEEETFEASSEYVSKYDNKELNLVMEDCPINWPHEVLRHDSAGMPAAQVCRSENGDGQWRCAKGWKSVNGDPFCVKVPTRPITDLFVRSGEENLQIQTHRQFVSENFKLLFYQLPGTVVEISPSVFRVLRTNETFDQSLLEHYHKFTFIMHPCLRLLKIWEAVSKPTANVSFTSFLNGGLPPWKPLLLFGEKRVKTQTEILFEDHRQVYLDQIMVLERWNESLLELMRRAKIDSEGFHAIGAMSLNNTQCSHLYTQETWLKMTNSYAMDFCVFKYSTKVNETHIIPPLDLTMQVITSRYNACRKQETDKHTSEHINSPRSIITSPNPCVIHTYYQPAYDNPKDLLANQNVLNLWEKIWASAGWQTRILNESNAVLHPDYENLKEKFLSFPTINAQKYTVGNFIRHVAMATVGGGWMADYDTLPLHFPPCNEIPFNGSFTVWSRFVPALVSGHGDEYTRVAHLMADVGLRWRDHPDFFLESDGRAQVSDMKTLSVLVEKGHVKSFNVIIETSDYRNLGFSCNKTKSFKSTNFPEGIPSLPWGLHVSHAFTSYMRSRNITLGPGLSWQAERANKSSFRTNFIKYVYGIYLGKCHLK